MANRTPSTQPASARSRLEQPPLEFGVFGHALAESSHQGAQRKLLLYGRLDLASARALDAELLGPIAHPGGEITVDLTGVSEVDRLALRVLIRRQRLAQAEGFRLFIRLATDQAAHLA